MTREQVIKACEHCLTNECDGCPNTERANCVKNLLEECLRYIQDNPSATLETAQCSAASYSLVGEIMAHYSKPLVNISFQEMEGSE